MIYPDNDACKAYEWVGGVEDIHITEDEAGTYYVYYTAWNGKSDSMIAASSKDLLHWTKHGPVFGDRRRARTGVVVSRLEGNRLVATRINGKYWMYFGLPSHVATSDNLIDWTQLLDKGGRPISAVPSRKGCFDSGSCEAGAVALLTDEGILLMYNAYNRDNEKYPKGWSGLGQALLARTDPTQLLDRLDEPFLHAQYDWELEGFCSPALVANGLVFFQGEWLLYYGGADRRIGLAGYRAADP